MSIKVPNENQGSGRSLEEDIERLQEAGLVDEKDKQEVKTDKHGDPEPEEQRRTGDTERSDRRL